MSEEEMKVLVEMNNMLKAKLEQQTKVYQQSLQEMQMEIDDLQRNCDFFNEQMNDAVERATELQIENTKLKQMWEELKQISQNDDEGENTAHDFLWFLEQTIEELEQKYELGE